MITFFAIQCRMLRGWPGNFKLEVIEDKNVSSPALFYPTAPVGEMVVSGDDDRSFMIVVNGSVRKVYQYETPKVTYLPTNDLMVRKK